MRGRPLCLIDSAILLCRKYDYSKFGNRVTECGFPDHHPPPLQTLLDIMNEMLEWNGRSSRHVAVVHCLAGKGRTGVVCSCFLLLTGYYGSVFKLRKERDVHDMANHAIRDFWTARGQGVRFPSQALYIYYFIKVLRRLGRTPTRIPRLLPAKRMVRTQSGYPSLVDALLTYFKSHPQLLKSVTLYGIPDFEAPPRGGCTPFLQVLPAPSQYEKPNLLYNSSWQRPVFETYVPDDQGTIVFQVSSGLLWPRKRPHSSNPFFPTGQLRHPGRYPRAMLPREHVHDGRQARGADLPLHLQHRLLPQKRTLTSRFIP